MQERVFQMSKLIRTFRTAPTAANHAKLARYLDRHPMTVCFATDEEQAFLKANGFDV